MTIAGLPCPPIPGWLTQFGSGCFIREDYSVNGEVQPSVFAIFYSWQAMYSTASEAVHDSGRFGLSSGRDLEVWSLKSFGGSSTFSLRKWQVSRRLRDQYPAEDQPKSTWWRTVDAVREKNCRDRWDQGAFKNLARSIIFSLRKQTFLTLCAECYIYPPILYVYTHAVWFFPETVEILHIFLDFGKKEPNWLILMHLHCWKSGENSRVLRAFSVYFFGPDIQWCYFLTNFRSGQLSTFNFGTLGDQVANNQLYVCFVFAISDYWYPIYLIYVNIHKFIK